MCNQSHDFSKPLECDIHVVGNRSVCRACNNSWSASELIQCPRFAQNMLEHRMAHKERTKHGKTHPSWTREGAHFPLYVHIAVAAGLVALALFGGFFAAQIVG